MRITKKKIVGAVAVSAVVAMGAGTAFAFWTSTGSGTGSATAGTTVGITVNQTSASTGFTVDEVPVPLSGDFDNTNTFAVSLTTVTATITGVAGGSLAGKPACTSADFMIEGTGVVAGSSVPAGTSVGSWDGLTIRMVNKLPVTDPANNQDNCKDAVVSISYSAA